MTELSEPMEDVHTARVNTARDNALMAEFQVFGLNFYTLLINNIPEYDTHERYELISRINFRQLRSKVAKYRSAAHLGRWLRQQASLDEATAVAWGLCNILGQIEECRRNGGEGDFWRHHDVAKHGHPVQVCLFGLDYLIFCYE